jgi:hypothetical protein
MYVFTEFPFDETIVSLPLSLISLLPLNTCNNNNNNNSFRIIVIVIIVTVLYCCCAAYMRL